MSDLSGRTALVTGAGSGIGRATALLLASRGAAVAVNDVDAAAAADTVEAIRAAGGSAQPAPADVADKAAVDAMAAALGPVDILVNNAGISGRRAPFETIDEAQLERMLAVTVKGTFHCAQAVVPGMIQRRRGAIVNVASIGGMVGFRYSSHYCAAKAAVLGLTKSWAKEFAPHGIRVNAVAPGIIDTPMTPYIHENAAQILPRLPLGRFGQPKDVAEAVVFLAGASADYLTGQVISPNGGEVIIG